MNRGIMQRVSHLTSAYTSARYLSYRISNHTNRHQNSHKPQTQPSREGGRKWNVSPKVQSHLRNAIFSDPKFTSSIFSVQYPINNHEQIKTDLQSFYATSPDQLKSALMAFSTEELEMHFQNLAVSGVHQNLETSVLGIITDVCIQKLIKLDLLDQLKLTDILYHLGCINDQYMQVFYQSLLVNWESLPLNETYMLQIVFYMGVYRVAPFYLLEKIEAYLATEKCNLTGKQIGLVCHTFFACNRAILDYGVLNKFAQATLRDADFMAIDMICNVMKVMRQGGFKNHDFYRDIGDIMCENDALKKSRTLPSVSNITNAYSAARLNHPKLMAAVREKCTDMIRTTHGFVRMKDLGRVLWSFLTLQESPAGLLLDELERDVVENREMCLRYPEVYVQSVLGLVMAQRFPQQAINAVFSPQHLNQRKYRSLEQIYQFLMLNSLVEVNYPQYDGHKMSREEVSRLREERDHKRGLALHTRQGLAITWFTLQDLLGGQQKVKCGYITDFTLIPDLIMEIGSEGEVKDIGSIASSEEERKLRDGLLEKQHTSTCHAETEGVLATLLTEHHQNITGQTFPAIHLPPFQRNRTRKISVKVLSEKQYLENEVTLVGLHQAELETLTKLGYEVLTVSPQDATRLEQLPYEDRPALVQKLVLDKLELKPKLELESKLGEKQKLEEKTNLGDKAKLGENTKLGVRPKNQLVGGSPRIKIRIPKL